MFAGEEKGGLGERREVVYRVDIKDEIGPGIWRLVKRSFDRATDENADVILVHMNTYGGEPDVLPHLLPHEPEVL